MNPIVGVAIIVPVMSKAVGSRRKKPGPKPLGKITVTIRMFPERNKLWIKLQDAPKNKSAGILKN